MLRIQPVVAILALVGLFAVSVLVGYVGGQTFLTPATSQRPRPARPVPVPEPAPSPLQTTPLSPAPSPALDLPASGRTQVAPEPVSPTQLTPPAPSQAGAVLFRVQVGAFISRENAEARAVKLREEGFDAYVSQSGTLWKVQVGAFSVRENAERLAEQLRTAGYEVLITP